jgi:predicted dehydrogenase
MVGMARLHATEWPLPEGKHDPLADDEGYEPVATGVADRMAQEGRHFASQLQSPEAHEAFAAFMERRKPDFSKVS